MGNRSPWPINETKTSAELIWNEIKDGVRDYGIETLAKRTASTAARIGPQSRWLYDTTKLYGVLEPMAPEVVRAYGRNRLAASVLQPVSRLLNVGAAPLAAVTAVTLNSTNRFPGSSWEQKQMQDKRMLDKWRQDEREHDRILNQAFARQQDNLRRNILQLKPPRPQRFNSPAGRSNVALPERIEPFRLRPSTKINTPFNARLLRPSPISKQNPFGLSVIGRSPRSAPFGLRLGTPQLRAPKIGR